MKVWEIVKIGGEIIEMLQKSCMSMDDCRYVEMYEEYVRLMNDGAKKARVAPYLAKKYNMSERRVYYLLKKFGKECKFGAV
jgi:Mor family transcriptional regulator